MESRTSICPKKNYLGKVKRYIWVGGIFLIGSVWITQFPITLVSASCQKMPPLSPPQPEKSLPVRSSGKQVFFNNLILNFFLKRLELIRIVTRARKGAVLGARNSSETSKKHV